MALPNLKVRYRRIYENDPVRIESIVELKQQGDDVLYVIRFLKSIGKYYLAKTHWSPTAKTFHVEPDKGDFVQFSGSISTLKSYIPLEDVF